MRVKFYVTLLPVVSGDHLLGIDVSQTIRKRRPDNGNGVAVPIELEVDPAVFQLPVLRGRVSMEHGEVRLVSASEGDKGEE